MNEIEPDGPAEGEPIGQAEELLYRQCYEPWLKDGKVTSRHFRPRPSDYKRLSTARSSMISAAEACAAHVAAGGQTAGAWAVTVREAEVAGTPAYHDGGVASLPVFHASLYFGGKSTGQQEKASKLLRHAAEERGCVHAWAGGALAS